MPNCAVMPNRSVTPAHCKSACEVLRLRKFKLTESRLSWAKQNLHSGLRINSPATWSSSLCLQKWIITFRKKLPNQLHPSHNCSFLHHRSSCFKAPRDLSRGVLFYIHER